MRSTQLGVWDAATDVVFTEKWSRAWEGKITRTCVLRDSVVGVIDAVLHKFETSGIHGDKNSMSPLQRAWMKSLPAVYALHMELREQQPLAPMESTLLASIPEAKNGSWVQPTTSGLTTQA